MEFEGRISKNRESEVVFVPGIIKSINTISRCHVLFRNRELEGILNGSHTMFVHTVMNNPGCTQDSIAQRICLNKSTVARALATLEEQGYVNRVQDPEDKRKLLVYPTERMEEIFPRVKELAAKWRQSVLAELTPEESEFLGVVLEKIERAARQVAMEDDKL
jgi:DNA-binding MarR family transcriptional regulator